MSTVTGIANPQPVAPSIATAAANSTETLTSTQAARNSAAIDYDSFLSLLVTQLRNQDPTAPTDNAELMSQLASFSSVEQQIQTNEKLDSLITSNALGEASNLIGKTITSPDGLQTGTVTSVVLTEKGVQAELQNGTRLSVTNGTTISGT